MSFLRVYAAALFLAFPSAPVAAGPGETGSNVGVADLARVHIDNFGRINASYYRGAQPQGRDYADLAALGVKTVINLTSDDAEPDERAMAEQAGMAYRQIPMTTHNPPTPEQLAEFLTIMNAPANQPVFVHCVGGKHRTGIMTAASIPLRSRQSPPAAQVRPPQRRPASDEGVLSRLLDLQLNSQ